MVLLGDNFTQKGMDLGSVRHFSPNFRLTASLLVGYGLFRELIGLTSNFGFDDFRTSLKSFHEKRLHV